jgi:hypothetical protein
MLASVSGPSTRMKGQLLLLLLLLLVLSDIQSLEYSRRLALMVSDRIVSIIFLSRTARFSALHSLIMSCIAFLIVYREGRPPMRKMDPRLLGTGSMPQSRAIVCRYIFVLDV